MAEKIVFAGTKTTESDTPEVKEPQVTEKVESDSDDPIITEEEVKVKKITGYYILGNFRNGGQLYTKGQFLKGKLEKGILESLIDKGVIEKREEIING